MRFSLSEQVEAAERELGLRKRVYPKRVAAGQMTQQLADRQIGLMAAIVETLRGIDQAEKLL